MEDVISLMRGTQEFQKNLATTKSNYSTVSKYCTYALRDIKWDF